MGCLAVIVCTVEALDLFVCCIAVIVCVVLLELISGVGVEIECVGGGGVCLGARKSPIAHYRFWSVVAVR